MRLSSHPLNSLYSPNKTKEAGPRTVDPASVLNPVSDQEETVSGLSSCQIACLDILRQRAYVQPRKDPAPVVGV